MKENYYLPISEPKKEDGRIPLEEEGKSAETGIITEEENVSDACLSLILQFSSSLEAKKGLNGRREWFLS